MSNTPQEAFNAALAALQRGQFAQAEAAARRLVTQVPGHADGWHMLGIALWQTNKRHDAIDAVRHAIAASPDRGLYHQSIGNMFSSLGDYDMAAEAFQAAVRLAPNLVDSWNNLGVALRLRGHALESVGAFKRALQADPRHFDAMVNLGMALREIGQHEEAAECFRRALLVRPEDAVALGNLGAALLQGGEIGGALSAFDRSLSRDPDQPETLCNRGTAKLAIGDQRGALSDFERALKLKPGFAGAARNMLNAALFDISLSKQARFDLHCRAMRALAPDKLPPRGATSPVIDRKLRIAYLSSDFRGHPVARNFLPMFRNHDRSRFEIFCYADVVRPDPITEDFRTGSSGFRNIAGLEDAAVAQMIRDDRIDILVFMAGRFDRNRPEIAWLGAAPVQISFHDCATSGIPTMDYIVADRHLAPKNGGELFTERPLRLPLFYLHEPMLDAPNAGPLPLRRNGYVTFGSFNNPAKLTEPTFANWAAALNAVSGSRLLLKYKSLFADQRLCDQISERMRQAGADPARIDFAARTDDTAGHLANYRDVDIALDAFPFSGSTTSFEALSMGVPVITMAGPNMVSRWTLAMLRCLGLDHIAAQDAKSFGSMAATLARDADALEALRQDLPHRVAASPLCDAAAKTRQIERLFRAVWRRHCANAAKAG